MSHKNHILALCQDLPPVFFLSPQPQKRPFHKRHQYSPRPIGLKTGFFKIIQVGWSTLTFLFQLQNCWELFLDHINGRLSEWGCLQVDYIMRTDLGRGASLGDGGRYFLNRNKHDENKPELQSFPWAQSGRHRKWRKSRSHTWGAPSQALATFSPDYKYQDLAPHL